VELPDPEAGPGEVRIRVHAAAVNPTDTGLRSGGRAALLKDIPPPYVPGMDAAGILDQIGAGVSTDLQVGDRVMAIVVPHGSRGAYSEFVVVPAESVTRVPAGATDAEAATLPMNGLTTRQALDLLGVERVDHGVRSMEDPELVARLRDQQIPLTVCPLSNVALGVVPALGGHVLPGMLDAGLLATVNSDDPAYFGGYVDDNLAAVQREFGFDDKQLAGLARNSFDACFAPEADKARWKAEVDSWLAAGPSAQPS